jgi:hypothetical protein
MHSRIVMKPCGDGPLLWAEDWCLVTDNRVIVCADSMSLYI